jgi:hypothetical protein
VSFDNSRYIFNPWNNYSSVVMPQGRVQLDADWNEWLSEIARRIQAGTLDTMGRAVYPLTTPNAFYISGSSAPSAINIGMGRMYVDGLLAENHGVLANATWDPGLAELSGSPQPAPASIGPTANDTPYTSQPYLPNAALPAGSGPYLFYLDVWTRAVTWLQDPEMVDKAVGVDTSGRLQTVWQVRWLDASAASSVTSGTPTPIGCGTPDASIVYPTQSYGLLMNGTVPNSTSGPCCLSDGTGYTGVENQFYRVEIHQGGPLGTATFKWSKENASVITSVTAIASLMNAAKTLVTVLTVASLGRDQVLGFNNGDWIEITNDTIELAGMPDISSNNPYGSPGLLCQIDHVEPATNQIYLTAPINTASYPGNQFGITTTPAANMRIRRWDQSSTVYSTDTTGKQTAYPMTNFAGDIPVPASSTTLVLEDGITVTFSFANGGDTFNSGDFWTFAARTFDGSLDPQYPFPQPPRGIHHHYTKLSVITFNTSGTSISNPDCRKPWPPSGNGNCGCCTATVGDGQTSFGQYNSIQQAINSLNMPQGGEVCILPGTYYENVLIQGLAQVTLRGSGVQTVWNSYSEAPATGTYDEAGANNPANNLTTSSGISAILTITGSQNIELTGFTMQAPAGMSCILLDQSVTVAENAGEYKQAGEHYDAEKRAVEQTPGQKVEHAGAATGGYYGVARHPLPMHAGYYHPEYSIPVGPSSTSSSVDVTISELVLAASTSPAIAAVQATALNICDNRILMQDVASDWPAIYVSGDEIAIEDNWIGLNDNTDAENYAPPAMTDAQGSTITSTVPATWTGNGGVQVGGFSTGVEIVNNQIEGGAFNGITLGGILQLQNGTSTGGLNGLFLTSPVTSNVGTTLVLPATSGNNQLGADGPLQDIRIEGNTITSMGLCGIGPVGFFTDTTTAEIVSIGDLRIVGNTISGSLQASIAPVSDNKLGYGAICLPDLQGLIVRDNIIKDFGPEPGTQVCGIYLLNGEQVEISRNQIIETRDWATITSRGTAIKGAHAGISIGMVSPPALNQTANTTPWTGSSTQGVSATSKGNVPLYEPGLPALTINQNVVRMALGMSLSVIGYGPFSITGNQLSTGGTIPGGSSTAINIEVINAGLCVEFDPVTTYSGLYSTLSGASAATVLQTVDGALSNSTNGTVIFTNNVCQTELRASGETGVASTLIFTLDHLNYSNNVTWMDGNAIGKPGNDLYVSAVMDAFLFGISLQVASNRLQESLGSVFFSGLTVGALNITSQNISTFCLFSIPASASTNNLCAAQVAAVAIWAAGGSEGDQPDVCGNQTTVGRAKAGIAGAPYEGIAPGGVNVSQEFVNTNTTAKITNGLSYADTNVADHVQQLAVVHQARVTQINRIANTITTASGATSALAISAKAAVASSTATASRMAMMKAQITAKAPAVTATGWAIYGHVYNASGAAVDAFSVYFVDSTNTYQSAYGIAYTASDGSYQIVSAGPAAGVPQLFLQIGNAAGNPVYASTIAFVPKAGAATYQDVTLAAGTKVLATLPTVLREAILPPIDKTPALNLDETKNNEENKG